MAERIPQAVAEDDTSSSSCHIRSTPGDENTHLSESHLQENQVCLSVLNNKILSCGIEYQCLETSPEAGAPLDKNIRSPRTPYVFETAEGESPVVTAATPSAPKTAPTDPSLKVPIDFDLLPKSISNLSEEHSQTLANFPEQRSDKPSQAAKAVSQLRTEDRKAVKDAQHYQVITGFGPKEDGVVEIVERSLRESNRAGLDEFYIRVYEEVLGRNFQGWFMRSGILELGARFGRHSHVVGKILKGCLGPIRAGHVREDLILELKNVQHRRFKHRSPIILSEILDRGTSSIALSYKQHPSKQFPGTRLSDDQVDHLVEALIEVCKKHGSERVVLWIDQVMTQREEFSTEKCVENGILPYFAFDNVLVLHKNNDPQRMWLSLEKKIASVDAEEVELNENVALFEKLYKQSTIDSIKHIAELCKNGFVRNKIATVTEDIKCVEQWAAAIWSQVTRNVVSESSRTYTTSGSPSRQVYCGSAASARSASTRLTASTHCPRGKLLISHKNRLCCTAPQSRSAEQDFGGFARLVAPTIRERPDWDDPSTISAKINRHVVDDGAINWIEKNLTRPIRHDSWHGVLELMGRKYSDFDEKSSTYLKRFLKLQKDAYMFKLFSANNGSDCKYFAVGRYKLSECWSRYILCELTGIENNRDTYVKATCLLSAQYYLKTEVSSFVKAFEELTRIRDCLDNMFKWPCFVHALQAKGVHPSQAIQFHAAFEAHQLRFRSYYDS